MLITNARWILYAKNINGIISSSMPNFPDALTLGKITLYRRRKRNACFKSRQFRPNCGTNLAQGAALVHKQLIQTCRSPGWPQAILDKPIRREFYYPTPLVNCYATVRRSPNCSRNGIKLQNNSEKFHLFPASAPLTSM